MSETLSFVDRLEALIPELRAFARSLCHDAVLADDLVQDTCLKAWSANASFSEDRPMRPWLFRILRNEFYQLKRRDWRTTALDPEFAENALVDHASLETLPDFALTQDFIYALPEAQRDAMILVLAAGMTYEEAGEICECSAGTIKSRVSRGREVVKASIEAAGKSSGASSRDTQGKEKGWSVILGDIDRMTRRPHAA